MRFILQSRFYQISFVSASLLFVLWLSASMWFDAFEQRHSARQVQKTSAQEELLFELANAIGAERRLAYIRFSTFENSQSDIDRLRVLSDETQSIAAVSTDAPSAHQSHASEPSLVPSDIYEDASAPLPDTSRHSIHNQHDDRMVTSHGAMAPGGMVDGQASSATMPQAASDQPAMMTMHNQHTGGHGHSMGKTAPAAGSASSAREIAQQLADDTEELYTQLLLPRNRRAPGLGMSVFHVYSSAIESIDDLRRSLQVVPGSSKRQFYIHSKLKDIIWNFRESVSQISSLIEGIVAMTETSAEMAQTRHHADMLMELNIRVDLAWNELLKISNSSEDMALELHTFSTATWYADVFKTMSANLAASSRYNDVSLDELRGWLSITHELMERANHIHTDSTTLSQESLRNVVRSATLNLSLVSVLVIFTLGMALASVVFFRRVEKQAHKDELTGLDNRRMFCMFLSKYLTTSKHTDAVIGLLMIDLDRFKYVNDTMGHAAGDQLLLGVSARINGVAEQCQCFARLGGDEFAMLFLGCDPEELQNVAESIRQKIMEPFYIDGAVVNIGSSIGIAYCPRDASSHDKLIKAADLAMYCAKKSGTNKIMAYERELDNSMAFTAKLVSDLQAAIQLGQFELFYQPQFNLAKNSVLSVEALIRWNHPERGLVSPNDFIPVAEENGLLPLIGDWVLNEACRQASVWFHEKNLKLRVAVNISSDHFFQPNFVQEVFEHLERHKLPPQLLELEVTESVALNDINLVVASLASLRESSIHVALDDFGTGYSSLSYLQDLPLDTLKIDKSFIQKLLQGNVKHDSITETIVALGQSLHLETVAEGVETSSQLSVVSDLRISVVQGYYDSKPVSAAELENVVRKINDGNDLQRAA